MQRLNASRMSNLVEYIREDIAILTGEDAGSQGSWQDHAGTLATNLESLANMLHRYRAGEAVPPVGWHPLTHLNARVDADVQIALDRMKSERSTR